MVFSSSLELAKKEPVIFLPKLVSVTISSLWIIGLINSIGGLYLYFIILPLIVYLTFFTSVLVASMADKPENSLKKHLSDVYELKYSLGALLLALFILNIFTAIPLLLGAFLILETSYNVLGSIISILSIVLALAIAFYLYFIPIAFIKKKRINSTLRDSYKISSNYSKEVLIIFLVSILLLVVAQASEGLFQSIGYIGFMLARMVESLVSTYIFILGSKFYLEKN